MTAYTPAYITYRHDGTRRRTAATGAPAGMMMDMMMCSRPEPDAGHPLP